MLFPEEDPSSTYIMISRGSGIAHFRGFIRRLFVEKTRVGYAFRGRVWLISHAQNSDSLLYHNEMKSIQKEFPDQFQYESIFPQSVAKNEDALLKHVENYSQKIYKKLTNGAHIYFSGDFKVDDINTMKDLFKSIAGQNNEIFDEWFKDIEHNQQWHTPF